MNEENKPLTAESVLQKHAQKYFNPNVKVVGKEFNPCDGDFILQKKEILPAMEEYAVKFSEKFVNWKNNNGWIRRPFKEESGVYLYDNHGVSTEQFNYDNGQTFQQLISIFKSSIKS